MDIKDKEGNVIELDEAALNEIRESAIDEYKEANPEIEKVEELKTQLQTATEELDKLKNKDTNFGKVKQEVAEKEDQIKELEEKLNEQVNSVREFVVGQKRENLIKQLSGGDEELEKKIRHHYDTTLKSVEEADENAISEKVVQAYKLSSQAPVPDMLGTQVISSSGASVNIKSNPISPELRQVAGKLGLTEEDLKKHGSKYGING